MDVFFAEKPDYIADAQVYIVTTENGLPTTTVVPGSHVTLPYQQISVPTNGRNETKRGSCFGLSFFLFGIPCSGFSLVPWDAQKWVHNRSHRISCA